MPIYEYQCSKCGFIKETFHKISEEPKITCPECSHLMKKLISSSSFHLKGSGWYVTDYKKNNSDNNKKSQSKTSCGNTKKCDNGTCSTKKAANA